MGVQLLWNTHVVISLASTLDGLRWARARTLHIARSRNGRMGGVPSCTWHDIVRRGMCISIQCATTTTATTIYTQININFQRRLQSSVQFAMTNEAEQMPFYRSFSFVLRRSLDWLNRHTHTHTPSNNRGCAFLCLHFMNKYQQLKSVIYNWSIPELNVRRVEFWTSVDCGGQEWSGEWWYAVRKRIRTRSAAQLILFAVRSNASILMFRNQLQRLNVDWRTGNISK